VLPLLLLLLLLLLLSCSAGSEFEVLLNLLKATRSELQVPLKWSRGRRRRANSARSESQALLSC
jgi:hypothetical protein